MVASALSLLAAAAAPAAAGEPAKPPPPRWIVDWAQNQCSLIRERGGAPNAGISFQLVPGTGAVDIAVVDERWKSYPAEREETLTFRLDGAPPVDSKVRLLRGRGRFGLLAYELDRTLLERIAGTSAIKVAGKSGPLLELLLPGAPKALAALKDCEDDALRKWGIDAAALANLQRWPRPKRKIASVINDADYPVEALRQNHQGTTVVRITIGPDGKVGDCGVVSTSGSALLDARTCTIMTKRVEFEPALGPDGQPTAAPA